MMMMTIIINVCGGGCCRWDACHLDVLFSSVQLSIAWIIQTYFPPSVVWFCMWGVGWLAGWLLINSKYQIKQLFDGLLLLMVQIIDLMLFLLLFTDWCVSLLYLSHCRQLWAMKHFRYNSWTLLPFCWSIVGRNPMKIPKLKLWLSI